MSERPPKKGVEDELREPILYLITLRTGSPTGGGLLRSPKGERAGGETINKNNLWS